jgi:hypothetical protein
MSQFHGRNDVMDAHAIYGSHVDAGGNCTESGIRYPEDTGTTTTRPVFLLLTTGCHGHVVFGQYYRVRSSYAHAKVGYKYRNQPVLNRVRVSGARRRFSYHICLDLLKLLI